MDRDYARSMVITRSGIAATSQVLASQAGAMTLARGGNAMDAAIAANAVLAVVEPMSCGIGGDLFAIYSDGTTGKLTGINASGWAPAALTPELLRARGYEAMPPDGILSATVPGCVEGWQRLHDRLGYLSWSKLFQPAIYYAREGFPVTEMIQGSWGESADKIPLGDTVPQIGELRKNLPLAGALKEIADEGAEVFYRGRIAGWLLAASQRLGGLLEKEDLSEFQSEWVTPISTTYRGWQVYELPPNGQGIAALEMLNTLERFPLSTMDPLGPEALHLKIEAQGMAYADLARYVGDPRFSTVPVEKLLSKTYRPGDTVYLSVVDRAGNIASLIQSIFHSFGSGVFVEEGGFHLHNRGSMFVLDEGHPNQLQPRKRPFHTIIPAFMQNGQRRIGFGIMGGMNQAQAHAQFVSNVVDHGMNLQAALEAPRFTRLSFSGGEVLMESRVPAATVSELRARGHSIELLGAYSATMGGGQAVMHDAENQTNFGASSPRKDGAAVPEPPPYLR